MAKRLRGRYGYPEDDPFKIAFHPNRFHLPNKWKKQRRIFVCSMGDLFHPDAKLHWIRQSLLKMTQLTRHTFLLLTKRPEIMSEEIKELCWNLEYTPKNIWLGVTAENQKRADERINILLQIPAAVRFISVEPMLSEIDMFKAGAIERTSVGNSPFQYESIKANIDWVICGGESGLKARPMHPDWPRSLRDQCLAANVPFFFKQWGEWSDLGYKRFEAPYNKMKQHPFDPDCTVVRIGKKNAGRLLDDLEWSEYPKTYA
jgi:protein gp37